MNRTIFSFPVGQDNLIDIRLEKYKLEKKSQIIAHLELVNEEGLKHHIYSTPIRDFVVMVNQSFEWSYL